MQWTVTLVAETEPGHVREHPLGQIEREDTITPASLGLSLAEGKTIVAALQTAIVTAQVERHGQALRPCPPLRPPAGDERLLHLDLSLGLWPGADARAPASPLPVREDGAVLVRRCCRRGTGRSRRNCCI